MPRPMSDSAINRRQFLGSSAKNAAGVAAGVVSLSAAAVLAQGTADPIRIGCIGVRNQGKELAVGLAGLPGATIAAVCDVDEGQLPAAVKAVENIQGTAPQVVTDFRRVLDNPAIDAVVIATPDHWHAIMTIMACQAGKHVYVESPVSHTLEEGAAMVAAARQSHRVVQSGLQQRSGAQFQSAIDYVRSGRLGKVRLVKAWTSHMRKSIGHKADAPVPQGVNYEMWLGPAAQQAFNPNRFHHNWHWNWEYGSGELGNWGVHMLDIARWGLDVEWPTQVSAMGGQHYFEDDQQTPDTLLVNFTFPGSTIAWEHRLWSPQGIEGRSTAVAFCGDQATLMVDRGGWKVYGPSEVSASPSTNCLTPHLQNFLDAIRHQAQPVADLQVGHVSSGLCHLGNIAYRVGRTLQFDAERERFVRDPVADVLLGRDYRAPWSLPDVNNPQPLSRDA